MIEYIGSKLLEFGLASSIESGMTLADFNIIFKI